MAHRPERLAEAIKQEISDVVRDEMKDPRIGFVTITRVEVTADLRYAKVYVSVLGEEKEQNETVEGLKKAKGFMRSELGKRIRLRHVPEISFILDQSMDRGIKVLNLLNRVKDKGEIGDE